MGKYTALARKYRDNRPQERGAASSINTFNVNMASIYSSRDNTLSKPTSDTPEQALEGSFSVESSQTYASCGEEVGEQGNELTNYEIKEFHVPNEFNPSSQRSEEGEVVSCIHGTTKDKCAVCSGYVRWLIADEERLRRAQSDSDGVRREFWRALRACECDA